MKIWDTIIVGAGSAGLPAGIYAARYGMSSLILSEDIGGLLATTTDVENYPGFKKIEGPELMKMFEEHARSLGVEIKLESVKDIKKNDKGFDVITSENTYKSRTVILAMGMKRRRLPAKGDEQFYGKGVSYCTTCDGAFAKGKIVGVVGGGDSAVHGATIASSFADKTYIFVRGDKFRAEPINVNEMKKHPKVEIRFNTEVMEVYGDRMMQGVKLNTGEDIKLQMLFVEIGSVSPKEFLDKIGIKTNENGLISIDKYSRTNVPGLFAAGDLTDIPLKQTITAAAYGSIAALGAYEHIKKGGNGGGNNNG